VSSNRQGAEAMIHTEQLLQNDIRMERQATVSWNNVLLSNTISSDIIKTSAR